jgi:tetratricopeptide (TPR) repeat protein
LRQALDYWPTTSDPVAIARLTKNLAFSLTLQGKQEAALAHYHHALEKIRHLGNGIEQAEIENNLGILHLQTGHLAQAEATFRQALYQTLPKNSHNPIRASLTHNLGETYLAQNRLFEASHYVRQAIVYWQQLGNQLEIANSTGVYGTILRRQDHIREATLILKESLAILNQFSDHSFAQELIPALLNELAQCHADP